MAVIGFIGMGNMGYALLKGIKPVFDEDIIFHLILLEKNTQKIIFLHVLTDIIFQARMSGRIFFEFDAQIND